MVDNHLKQILLLNNVIVLTYSNSIKKEKQKKTVNIENRRQIKEVSQDQLVTTRDIGYLKKTQGKTGHSSCNPCMSTKAIQHEMLVKNRSFN